MRWIVVVLALVAGGWLAFDGAYALISGDYVTPGSGPHAGQLGPWSNVFTEIGLDPRSPVVKNLHLVIGSVWLGATLLFALGARRGWIAMLLCALAGLWYLRFGTLISLTIMGLLFVPALRAQYSDVT